MSGRSRFVLLALVVYAACAAWATWPAIRHVDDAHYLARPAAGHGEAAAGDHLQLGWAFWLVGHQLEHRASPFEDPYSFRPEAEAPPSLREVVGVMVDHAQRLCAFFGPEVGMRQMRKWCAWYTKGFRGSSAVRESLVRVGSIEAMLAALSALDMDEPFPLAALRAPRGKTGRQHQVRIHLAHLALPIVGDAVYGRAARGRPLARRPMLHAARLAFDHPVTGVRVEVDCPPPADFERVLHPSTSLLLDATPQRR